VRRRWRQVHAKCQVIPERLIYKDDELSRTVFANE
jgi:hypothetical protein